MLQETKTTYWLCPKHGKVDAIALTGIAWCGELSCGRKVTLISKIKGPTVNVNRPSATPGDVAKP